jgi:hypothetical protein
MIKRGIDLVTKAVLFFQKRVISVLFDVMVVYFLQL